MLFFSIAVGLRQTLGEDERVRLNQEASLSSLRFYEQAEDTAFVFIDALQDKGLKCIAMVSNATLKDQSIENLTKSFLSLLSVQPDTVETNEITCSVASQKLRSASKGGHVSDYDNVMDELGIRWIGKGSMAEKMIPSSTAREAVMKKAAAFYYVPGFFEEMARIYQQSTAVPYCGHPVHYIIEMDNHEAHLQITELLLSALHVNRRIRSRRYVVKEYASVEPLDAAYLQNMFETCEGGACVIDYASGDRGQGDVGPPDEDALAMICGAVNRFKHSVLTVICVSPSQKAIGQYLISRSPFLAWVHIANDGIDPEGARCYLRDLARGANMPPDDSLMKAIKPNQDRYTLSQLQENFDVWRADYLLKVAYPQYAAFGKEPEAKPAQESVQQLSALAKLQRMTGLHEAKTVIDQLLCYNKAQELYTTKGAAMDPVPMHMVFTGNPGTAKTTVARLYAQIMKDGGLLSVGNLIEVGRADLVGKYVGWTARLVREKFKAARGSILFIDEAYSLVDDRDGMYGDEAINTIVQEMENHRDDMAVIFAGYPSKMEGFLNKNPGLRSRISFRIHFPDYSAAELFDIMEALASGSRMQLAADVKRKLVPLFENARKQVDFGNGRFVRNAFEKARLCQASRLLKKNNDTLGNEDVMTLCGDDFDMTTAALAAQPQRMIGFGF